MFLQRNKKIFIHIPLLYDLALYFSPKYIYTYMSHALRTGPSCSKHPYFNELDNDKLLILCSYGIFKYIDIFCCKNVSSFCNAMII